MNEDAARVPASRSYAELLEDYVQGGWYDNHYRAERGWPLLRTRRYVLEQDLSTEEERRKLPHYNELYLRWGYPGFIAIPFVLDGRAWCLPMLRGRKNGFFTHEEGARLARFAPHFRRMMFLSEQFSQRHGHGGLEALDRIDRAAVLIDWQGRVKGFNAKAQALLARVGNALFLNGGGHLHATHPESESRLQALYATLRTRNFRDRRRKEVAPIRIDRSDHRPLLVEAVSLDGLISPASAPAHSILLITDLDERETPATEHLRTVLKLTPAEADLCVLMCSGMTLAEAGDHLQITSGTARQRLKGIFQKTETNRQSELISLLSRLPPARRN
ncbi:helix-turn-helix transcriptional regulator [Chelativorans salis]|uniref:Helix-turn-helix transcriptional regulator n=1 Tax=Chelativorans salis TaxID=2978478 RepID=A0ABT2LNF1_9HYPH|nr:helix-turn-helix transcriptional regulator [Chelativorans sp. EGI FJ00035]MCT7375811.1 helix-turn-helix transcriptional regulator [Chelativorans sp. EGI FJ00035]